jgi:hypothetical protein
MKTKSFLFFDFLEYQNKIYASYIIPFSMSKSNNEEHNLILIEFANNHNLITKIYENFIIKNKHKTYYILVNQTLDKVYSFLFEIKKETNNFNLYWNDSENLKDKHIIIDFYLNKNKKKQIIFFKMEELTKSAINTSFLNIREEIIKQSFLDFKGEENLVVLKYHAIAYSLKREFLDILVPHIQEIFLFFNEIGINYFLFESVENKALRLWKSLDSKFKSVLKSTTYLTKVIGYTYQSSYSFQKTSFMNKKKDPYFNYQRLFTDIYYMKKRYRFPTNISKGSWIYFTSWEEYTRYIKDNPNDLAFIEAKITYKKELEFPFLQCKTSEVNLDFPSSNFPTLNSTFTNYFTNEELNYANTLNAYDIVPRNGYFIKSSYFLGRNFVERLFLKNKWSSIKSKFRHDYFILLLEGLSNNFHNKLNLKANNYTPYLHHACFLTTYARIDMHKMILKEKDLKSNITYKVEKDNIICQKALSSNVVVNPRRSFLYNLGRFSLK